MGNGSESKICICAVGGSETIAFAGSELQKYLARILQDRALISVEPRDKFDPREQDALWIGLWEDLSSGLAAESRKIPPVENPIMDDSILVDVKNGHGIIAGINERSVLLAVYKFLDRLGCGWLRPGKAGEFIPAADGMERINAQIAEKASYRHRGICIEGAVSYENVEEIIDWSPKVGFNSYFIQFREAYIFFERWYTHRDNTALGCEELPVEKAREFVNRAAAEIKKRGLIYHAVGHGWTCEPFGIPGLGWDAVDTRVPPETEQYLAEIDGKRELWKGVPLNTNLCYSNPEVRRVIVNSICDYIKEHREVDVLHFWLADGVDNQCECGECRKVLPSDFYVMMLNELDELLTEEGIDTKIVFLIYVDLLWAPSREKIKNPGRFILMFAPITRTYSEEFAVKDTAAVLPEYERNRTQRPTSVAENVGYLKRWQKDFRGDSFDFDYHFMWDHYSDPGYYAIAELLGRDIKGLKNIGLNGFISCQTQRAFFPTGLGMYVMGKTLWNDALEFEDLAAEYFSGAFGDEGEKCREYLITLSRLFDPPYLRNEKAQVDPEAADRFGRIPGVIESFLPVIGRNIKQEDGCRAQSWLYLKHHAEICLLLAAMLKAWAEDDKKAASQLLDRLVEMVRAKEMELQPALDVWNFIEVMKRRYSHV